VPVPRLRIKDALAPIAVVEAIQIDEDADLAQVVLLDDVQVSEAAVTTALDAVSSGSGHEYRLRAAWESSAT
jgi:hypothetical protein